MHSIQLRKKHHEHILALRAEVLPTPTDGLIVHSITNDNLVIAQRKFLETSSIYRQLIPYTLIRHKDSYFTYGRSSSGGEARLHGKLSIGVGGHVDISDIQVDAFSGIDLEKTISTALSRELDEEIQIEGNIISVSTMPHMICSNESEVDKVHLGLITIIEVDTSSITTKEDALIALGMKTKEELLKGSFELEYWTRLALQAIEMAP